MVRTCCHCTRPITPQRPGVTYAVSREDAHVRCVSFPSAAVIDQLLYERKLYEPAYTGPRRSAPARQVA